MQKYFLEIFVLLRLINLVLAKERTLTLNLNSSSLFRTLYQFREKTIPASTCSGKAVVSMVKADTRILSPRQ